MQTKTIIDKYLFYIYNYKQSSDNTVKSAKVHLYKFFRYLSYHQIYDIDDITKNIVEDYIMTLSNRPPTKNSRYYGANNWLSSKTLAMAICHIRWLLRYATEHWHTVLDYEKIKYCKITQAPIVTTDRNTIFRMVHAPYELEDSPIHQLRNSLLVRFVYETGCRVSEVCDSKRSYLHSNTLLIKGKGSKYRSVCISDELLAGLMRYRDMREDDYDCIFISHSNNKLDIGISRVHVSKIVRKCADYVWLDKFTTHGLRHCFATHLLDRGVDIFSIQHMLWHSSIQTTARYLSVCDSRIKNIYNQYQKDIADEYLQFKLDNITSS